MNTDDLALTSSRALHLDCRLGIDDSLALSYQIASPEIDLVGVRHVGGNISATIDARNSLNLLGLADRKDVLLAVGAHDLLEGKFDGVPHVHGDNSLGHMVNQHSDVDPIDKDAPSARLRRGRMRVASSRSSRLSAAMLLSGPTVTMSSAAACSRAIMERRIGADTGVRFGS